MRPIGPTRSNGECDEKKSCVGQSALKNGRQAAAAYRQAESQREGGGEKSRKAVSEFDRQHAGIQKEIIDGSDSDPQRHLH